jgi:hypothetical protein
MNIGKEKLDTIDLAKIKSLSLAYSESGKFCIYLEKRMRMCSLFSVTNVLIFTEESTHMSEGDI